MSATATSLDWSQIVLCAALLAVLYYATWVRRRSLPLPPGPPPLPLLGNILDMPKVKPWVTFRDWSEKYGSDVLYLHLPKQPTIVLNSASAAIDLLEGRATVYSDRLPVVVDELVGIDWSFGFMPYGPRWRTLRRIFLQHFRQAAVTHYRPIQTREIYAFLRRSLDSSDVNSHSISQVFAAIIMDVVYGIRIQDSDDEYITLSQKAVEGVTKGRMLGALWIEFFPWLKHLPAWLPGASAQKLGKSYKPLMIAMRDRPFDAVKGSMMSGGSGSSMVQHLLHDLEEIDEDQTSKRGREQDYRDAAGIAYGGAVETQLASTSAFLLAMVLFPEVQRKAQRELDSVIGTGRLPAFEDIEKLPYIRAILSETLRWMPALPLGAPHRVMVDDEYNGYFIPRGTILHPNIWAMSRDPIEYPEPETFNPDRFIRDGVYNHEVRDPIKIALGFGRRKCPGRFLAQDTLPLIMASILHVYDIKPATGDDGQPIEIKADSTTGWFSYPEKLPCVLKPRSAAVEQLIRQTDNNKF